MIKLFATLVTLPIRLTWALISLNWVLTYAILLAFTAFQYLP